MKERPSGLHHVRERLATLVATSAETLRHVEIPKVNAWLGAKINQRKRPTSADKPELSRVDYSDSPGPRAALTGMIRTLLQSRYRISTQIYLAFAGAVVLTITASLVGWFSFDRVGNEQASVNEGSVPAMTAAFGMAQHANTLVAAGPRLTATTDTVEFQIVANDIGEANVALVGQLALLQGQNMADERFARMRSYVDSLTSNTNAIQVDLVESFPRTARLERLRDEISDLDRDLRSILIPAADDQLFYAMTGYHDVGDEPDPPDVYLTEEELSRYRHLAHLAADAESATQILASAFGIQDVAALEPLRERFESALGRMDHDISALGGFDPDDEIAQLLERLSELGEGEQGALNLIEQTLRVIERRSELLSQNRSVAIDLLREVDVFVDVANSNVTDATLESDQAVLTGKVVLATLSAVSVGGAALIAWLFIGKVLLIRLDRLLASMRRMAAGDLEVEVDTSGRDEVADMADALEVFRKAALDALELDQVRRLNEQLEDSNGQLAIAIEDLEKAQDQIVARDKLAALGELTAGVAHEIRNPLNFVKNFSEVSDELLEELKEVLGEVDGKPTEDQSQLIAEIFEDLTSNLDRIQTHGNRADRIVNDMLMMGRGGGERQFVDINSLLDEHARLAFHSARAADPNFQLDLKDDFDPELGEVEVIPQDLGRVIVNLVSNAGYATNKRRLETGGTTIGVGSYMPTVWLSTRAAADRVEIRIRDNGDGIPEDVIDKIFNPFFTTKPANEGTGLGLAMCNDIVREHGGSIEVVSEPGDGTEMIVRIPRTSAAVAEASGPVSD